MRFSLSTAFLTIGLLSLSGLSIQAQFLNTHPVVPSEEGIDQSWYLPADLDYSGMNPDIASPEEYLGWTPGTWHISHDLLTAYMRNLAAQSDRVSLVEYARSWESRPLLLLAITSEENQAKLSDIQSAHLDALESGDADNGPVIIYQGYSVHGNEPSGANASMLYAWYLAAAESEELEQWLSEAVVLIDPCLNPDGLHRFAGWVNSHRSMEADVHSRSREHNEVWPGGRTNHYWYDLNRDWLLLRHPESRGRVGMFHTWRPHIVTDHHEMGTSSTFFFQPGIPSRTHPLTPDRNQELTAQIGTYHAAELEKIGSTFYSRESFDDFYYGKGSTYPDVNGSIGILFEQASSRGHLQAGDDGTVSFPFSIRNQVATSFSTLKAGVGLSQELREYQVDFVEQNRTQGADFGGGWKYGTDGDFFRAVVFTELLEGHQIEVRRTSEGDWFVPAQQDQFRLIKAIFEDRTEFEDSLFYDVSAWTIPRAFDLPYERLEARATASLSFLEEDEGHPDDPGACQLPMSEYGWLIDWNALAAPRLLSNLLEAGVVVKVATKPFEIGHGEFCSGEHLGEERARGTLFVRAQRQPMEPAQLRNMLDRGRNWGVPVAAVDAGQSDIGIDLGSPSFKRLREKAVAVLVGDGVRSYQAGEIWHLLDAETGMPATLLESDQIESALSDFDVLIMPPAFLGSWPESRVNALRSWVSQGGTLIAYEGSATWAGSQNIGSIKSAEKESSDSESSVESGMLSYGDASRNSGARVLGGAIFQAEADLTHPLTFGLQRDELAVFKRGRTFLHAHDQSYAAPVRFSKEAPLLSGYVHPEVEAQLEGSAVVVMSRQGSGMVVGMGSNTQFRGYWYGTRRLLLNAIFFTQTVDRWTASEEEEAGESHGHQH